MNRLERVNLALTNEVISITEKNHGQSAAINKAKADWFDDEPLALFIETIMVPSKTSRAIRKYPIMKAPKPVQKPNK